MQKKRIVINVRSHEIPILSAEPEEHILEVANYVDKAMENFQKSVPAISFSNLAILTSISIADELFKLKNDYKKLTEEKRKIEGELSANLGRIMMLEAEISEREKLAGSIKGKYSELEQKFGSNMDREDRLREKLNILSYELQKPHADREYVKELKEANELIDSMVKNKPAASPEVDIRTKQLGIFDVEEL